MARTPRLKLALLGVLVLLAHVAGLEWFARQADAISGLPLMAPPMYTRMLRPAPPPPPVTPVAPAAAPTPAPRPALRVATAPQPAASSPEELARERELTRQRALEHVRKLQEEREREQQLAQASQQAQEPEQAQQTPEPEQPAAEAPAPQDVASAPAEAASAPAEAASAPDPADPALAHWPGDTRLNYRLSGDWRGPLHGDARVSWQREGGKYQVRLDVTIHPFISQVITSQGEVTPGGLVPRAYEELRPGKRRAAQFGDQVLMLDNGRTVPRPPGVQDTASQFVELAQRFATGKETLEVGRTVKVWLARPGGLDEWTYDIVEREMLRTPQLGDVEAFHLKPRPLANPRGNITAEMWFAPSLQYLPVKIRVIMGTEAYLDLLVERIEQR